MIIEEGLEVIQNKQIQNSIDESKPISVSNNNSKVKETPSLMDSTQLIIKKVIISILAF